MTYQLNRPTVFTFTLIVAATCLLWVSANISKAHVVSSLLVQNTTFAYTYDRLPTSSVCGTTGPSPNQVEIQVLRKNSGSTIEVEVRKCDGSEFKLGGNYELRIDNNLYERKSYPSRILEIQIPLDPVKLNTPRLGFHDYQVYVYSSDQPTTAKHTGTVRVWEVYTKPTDIQTEIIYDIQPYRTQQCGENNIVGMELVQYSSPNILEAEITKCSGSSTFQQAGYLYLVVDGQPFLGPVRYQSGGTVIFQEFDPADYGMANQRHTYRAIVYADDQPTLRNKETGEVSALGQVPTDRYEPDNDFTHANNISTDGSSQTHTIHIPGDEDWMKFDAIAGYEYTIETFDLQGGADTVLGLFWDDLNDNHPDLILKDENPGDSLMIWTADQTATRWIKVRDTNPSLGGTMVAYSVKITFQTPTATPTVTLTTTPTPTNTPTNTSTNTPTNTSTSTATTTNTPTLTPTPTPTGTLMQSTSTPTVTPTTGTIDPPDPRTNTPTSTATTTPANITTNTPTATATATIPNVGDVSLMLSDLQGEPGSSIEMPVRIVITHNAQNVGGLSFDIVYDPQVVKAINCAINNTSDSGLCNPSFDADGNYPDRLRISVAEATGFSGQLTVATATFQIIGQTGTSSVISLSIRRLVDINGHSLSYNIANGSVQVMGSATTTPTMTPTEIPTITPTMTPTNLATPMPTVTATSTPPLSTTPSFSFAEGQTNGAPGSYFLLQGAHFPPNSSVTLLVNGISLPAFMTDAQGSFILIILTTPQSTPGAYEFTAAQAQGVSATMTITKDGEYRDANGLDGITLPTAAIYLPIIRR